MSDFLSRSRPHLHFLDVDLPLPSTLLPPVAFHTSSRAFFHPPVSSCLLSCRRRAARCHSCSSPVVFTHTSKWRIKHSQVRRAPCNGGKRLSVTVGVVRRATRTSPPRPPRWPTRSRSPASPSWPPSSTSNPKSTSPASEPGSTPQRLLSTSQAFPDGTHTHTIKMLLLPQRAQITNIIKFLFLCIFFSWAMSFSGTVTQSRLCYCWKPLRRRPLLVLGTSRASRSRVTFRYLISLAFSRSLQRGNVLPSDGFISAKCAWQRAANHSRPSGKATGQTPDSSSPQTIVPSILSGASLTSFRHAQGHNESSVPHFLHVSPICIIAAWTTAN